MQHSRIVGQCRLGGRKRGRPSGHRISSWRGDSAEQYRCCACSRWLLVGNHLVPTGLSERSDVGGKVSRLFPRQGHARHLRMRFQQEKCQSLSTEIRAACDCRKRRRLSRDLPLIGSNDVALGTPAAGEFLPVNRVGCKRETGACKRDNQRNQGREFARHFRSRRTCKTGV
jgi:hypothetical protein